VVQTIKATKDIGLDILAYGFAFIGSGVYSWLPGKPLMELIGRLRERYAHAGEIKPASPRRPGKKAVVILPGDSDGFVPLFGKRSFIEKQDCLRTSQVFVDHWMVLGQNESLGSNYVTYKALHSSHISSFNVQGHWLDRFSFKFAKLAAHIPMEILSRLAISAT
jgi:hypothetical protein